MLAGKIFLLTGSTGNIGCETVKRIEGLGGTVLPLVLNGYPSEPKRVTWNCKHPPIQIKNRHDLNSLPVPDYVIHFHWKVDRSLPFTKQLIHDLDHNLHRIHFFWEWIRDNNVKRCVNISSIKVFSHLNDGTITSDTEPRPISPYGIAKYTAEKVLDSFLNDKILRMTHVRLCSVASFSGHPTQILCRFCQSIFDKQPITVNTGQTVYIIDIDEAVDMVINAALVFDRRTYNLVPPPIKTDDMAVRFEVLSKMKLNAGFVDLKSNESDQLFASDMKRLDADWIRHETIDSSMLKILNLHRSAGMNPPLNGR
jgi:nucleoside-diphosphate-sugar epimerase